MKDVDLIKEREIAIIAGASSAIKEFKYGVIPDEEKIMSSVLKEVKTEKDLQQFVIAGANFAIKKKQKNLKSTERQIMQALSNEIPLMVIEIKENK